MDEDGHDGFPALGFRAGSDVKIAHRQILPEKLPAEFSILVRAKPRSRRGGYLFAVVNPLDTVVQLGVRLSPDNANTNISLIYTDSSQVNAYSRVPFKFLSNQWRPFNGCFRIYYYSDKENF